MPIEKDVSKKEIIFALDIGTKTVIGVVGYYDGEIFKIIDSELVEHKKRSMYDGQIHNIQDVAEVVKLVKSNLENRLSLKFDKVAIAAAGRALKTYRERFDRDIDLTVKIDQQMINSLEMETIQNAQEHLEKEIDSYEPRYYCVGHSVMNYYLDDNFIESLEGHSGNKIGVEVIATFLPHVVVDSLYTVMDRAGLEVMNLTLEPIAAINVAIKKDLRLLNLCLVDIGAGTSDIAITREGRIVAYDMVPIAGDEITERIAKRYLIGFDMAEKIKKNLYKNVKHKFNDIVGIPYEIESEEILNEVDEGIYKLATEIAMKIKACNKKSPSAVLMIGGGSQIPRLTDYVAKELDMPSERVVTKSAEIIAEVEGINGVLEGPQGITPVGIAVTAGHASTSKNFIEVFVNGEKVKLMQAKDVKVSDALVLVGYNPRKLIPKKGDDFVYFYNGELRKKRGLLGKPAMINVDGKDGNLETFISDGSFIEIEEATKGQTLAPTIADVVKNYGVYFDDSYIPLVESYRVNGNEVGSEFLLNEKDLLEVDEIANVEIFMRKYGFDSNEFRPIVNGNEVESYYMFEDGDTIEFEKKIENKNSIGVKINGEVKTIESNKDKFVFVDIFDYIDIDLKKSHGKLILKLNGEKADFTKELKDGDELDVYWTKNEM